MPKEALSVSRPGKWSNPFLVSEHGRAQAVELFRLAVEMPLFHRGDLLRFDPLEVEELRGLSLACWCHLCPAHAQGKPLDVACADCDPCHVDVLGERANRTLECVAIQEKAA